MNLLDVPPNQARDVLAAWARERELPGYRVRQIVPRLWRRPVAVWSELTDLPQALRTELERQFPLARLRLVTRQTSRDGTMKFLWGLADGAAIESVLIPEGARRTLCVSSQVGCAFGCTFCATGRMGFQRHLAPWEIAAQVRELALDPEIGRPTNVVFMGMGEPLHNWPAVDVALTILNGAQGLGIGARHITVSTVGIIPALAKLAARPEQFRLALSLHAPTSDRRRPLIPVERKYALADVLSGLRAFRRRVTFEYVLIHEANDTLEDADALAAIANPLNALVNLLPLHPGGSPSLRPTPPAAMRGFARRLRHHGVRATIRRSRGVDIDAACGQLLVATGPSRRVHPDEHADIEKQPGLDIDHHSPEAQRVPNTQRRRGITTANHNDR